MRTRGSSFPVVTSLALALAASVPAGCAHAPASTRATPTPSSQPAAPVSSRPAAPVAPAPEWMRTAPAARVVAINARDERRCRRETPLGSRVERVVCRTEDEERLRAEAAAERVRWGTSPTF